MWTCHLRPSRLIYRTAKPLRTYLSEEKPTGPAAHASSPGCGSAKASCPGGNNRRDIYGRGSYSERLESLCRAPVRGPLATQPHLPLAADTPSDTLLRGHSRFSANGIAVQMPGLNATRPSTDTFGRTLVGLKNRRGTAARHSVDQRVIARGLGRRSVGQDPVQNLPQRLGVTDCMVSFVDALDRRAEWILVESEEKRRRRSGPCEGPSVFLLGSDPLVHARLDCPSNLIEFVTQHTNILALGAVPNPVRIRCGIEAAAAVSS